jgi:hypothetical protein
MRRTIALSIATLALLAGLAAAEPQVTVSFRQGVPVIQLAGTFAGSSYTVYRAAAASEEFLAITASDLLCLGECLVADYDAQPGQTYFYRFDLALSGGSRESFGPYSVTIPRERPLSVRVSPNPGRGPATISITLAGRPSDPPVEVEAALFDIQGRALRTLHRGALARGTTALGWDGRDDNGRPLGSGLFFLRVRSAAGTFSTRIVRTR